MPMWPFTRKRRATKLKDSVGPTAVAGGKKPVAPYARHTAGNMPERSFSRRNSRRKRRSSSRSSISMRDADKASPDIEPIRTASEKKPFIPQGSVEDITALPFTKELGTSPHLRPITQDHEIAYNFQLHSHHSLPTAKERGKLQRPQTLRGKRSANDSSLPRRKSSKKRKNDHVREEEIRAMSMPLPQKRPAGSSGGLLRRDSKKIKSGLNRNFERPTSNISLPMEESVHSSMSGNSDSRAFRVSALDMFSPRPKIRYSLSSQYGTAGPSPTNPSRSNSRKERRPLVSKDGNVSNLSKETKEATEAKEDHKKNKRIDDLADTLDAGALREIMERDKRRREKKRKAEEERLRRRLERRAEKQRASEQRDTTGGTPAIVPNTAQGSIGLGIEKDSSTPMEDFKHERPVEEEAPRQTPVDQDMEAISQTLPTPLESPMEEPVVANAQAVHYSRASLSPPSSPTHTRGPSTISQMPALLSEIATQQPVEQSHKESELAEPLQPLETIESTESLRKATSTRRSSEGRLQKWASFLKRGKRGSADQGRITPSEVSFSNTSRESMSRQPLPAHLVGTAPIQVRRTSGPHNRGISKFREDLPEYPVSPPDSRMQSPEASMTPQPAVNRHGNVPPSGNQVDPNASSSSPIEDVLTRDISRTDSPVSPTIAPSGLVSQSLASVDSEGSWLSGKPMNRRSNKSHFRSSVGSARQQEDFSASYEELGIPDDEYFRRLTPQPDERRRSAQSGDVFARKPSSTAIAAMSTAAESDTEDELRSSPTERPLTGDEKVVANIGRQPTVVHRNARVKSSEGLLSYFNADEDQSHEESLPSNVDDAPAESPSEDLHMQETPFVQRAKSVDLGKGHVRQMSAGSAKLLDIPAKRTSSASQSRSRSPNPE